MKFNTKISAAAAALALLAVSCGSPAPQSFEQCVAAGGAVAGGVTERSCTIDGRTFPAAAAGQSSGGGAARG